MMHFLKTKEFRSTKFNSSLYSYINRKWLTLWWYELWLQQFKSIELSFSRWREFFSIVNKYISDVIRAQLDSNYCITTNSMIDSPKDELRHSDFSLWCQINIGSTMTWSCFSAFCRIKEEIFYKLIILVHIQINMKIVNVAHFMIE